jgi:hypothetical protein
VAGCIWSGRVAIKPIASVRVWRLHQYGNLSASCSNRCCWRCYNLLSFSIIWSISMEYLLAILVTDMWQNVYTCVVLYIWLRLSIRELLCLILLQLSEWRAATYLRYTYTKQGIQVTRDSLSFLWDVSFSLMVYSCARLQDLRLGGSIGTVQGSDGFWDILDCAGRATFLHVQSSPSGSTVPESVSWIMTS